MKNVLASNSRPNHPWSSMTNEEILKSARLYQTNFKTNESGYTLAAALIFGKDEVLQSILPAYKTDALVRIVNTDRYDDRDEVKTNLIESYDRLMQFIRKHLPDPFFLEGDQRISLRDIIFREAIINTLIHREFTNAYPARIVIDHEKVTIENWNLPVKHGLIAPKHFYTHPKNPNILQVFKEIRYADELGSGVRNIFKYTRMYSGGNQPEIREMDVFKITIPYIGHEIRPDDIEQGQFDGVIDGVIDGVTPHLKSKLLMLLKAIMRDEGKRATYYKMITSLGSERTIERYLQLLRDAALIEFKGTASKTGGYFLTQKAKTEIKSQDQSKEE